MIDLYTKICLEKYKLTKDKRYNYILKIVFFYKSFGIDDKSSFLITVNLFDRYIMESKIINEDILDIVLCACICIAIKSDDDHGYTNLFKHLSKFFQISNYKLITDMELELLILFDWRVHPIRVITDILAEWATDNVQINKLDDLDLYIIISQFDLTEYDKEVVAQAILSCISNIVILENPNIKKCKIQIQQIYDNFGFEF